MALSACLNRACPHSGQERDGQLNSVEAHNAALLDQVKQLQRDLSGAQAELTTYRRLVVRALMGACAGARCQHG